MTWRIFPAATVALILFFASPLLAQSQQRVMIYGDSNVWGWVPTEKGFPTERLPYEKRLTGLIDRALSDHVRLIEDGLNNRTTNVDDPNTFGIVGGPAFNGARGLPAILATHTPLDVVVVMLGTNDLKAYFGRTAEDSAQGIAEIIDIVKSSAGSVANTYDAPQILIVAPPPTGDMGHPGIAQVFEGAGEKSNKYAAAYAAVASRKGIAFLDASTVLGRIDGLDGIHMTSEEHEQLASVIADQISNLLKAAPIRE